MSDYPQDSDPIEVESVQSKSPCRTEYAVKDELFLEHCPLFASKKTIYWYQLIHPVDAIHLGAQGEEEFHHSIRRPKKALQESHPGLWEAIQRRAANEPS